MKRVKASEYIISEYIINIKQDKESDSNILAKPALRGLKISGVSWRGEKRGLRLHGGKDGPKRRLVNSCVCSVRSGRREALTRRANTKKKTRREDGRGAGRNEAGRERERKPRGRRKGEEPGKARRRLFKVRCKLCRPSAASIGRLFVQPPTQSTSFHLIKTPDPAGTQQPDSLTILPFFLFLSFSRPLFSIFFLLLLFVLLSTTFPSSLRVFELTRSPTLHAYRNEISYARLSKSST